MQFLFRDCVLDPDRRELTRESRGIAVGPQVFDLLAYLLQNRARVVSKNDLLDAVWGGRIVSESTLTSHINAVRKAIGDTGEEQRLVRTIARKGYRFVGEVRESDVSERPDPATPHDPAAPALTLRIGHPLPSCRSSILAAIPPRTTLSMEWWRTSSLHCRA